LNENKGRWERTLLGISISVQLVHSDVVGRPRRLQPFCLGAGASGVKMAATITASGPELPPFDFISAGPGYIDIRPPAHVWLERPCLNYATENLWTCLVRNATEHSERPWLGTRKWLAKERRYGEYEWLGYGDGLRFVHELGAGLMALAGPAGSLCPGSIGRGMFAGIFANNCAPWVLTEFALFRHSAVFVPLYATFGAPALAFCVRQAELRLVFCGRDLTPGLVGTTTELLRNPEMPNPLRLVVLLPRQPGPPLSPEAEAAEAAAIARLRDIGIQVVAWEDILDAGRRTPIAADPPQKEDLASVIFTSGTSGQPKGAVFTHHAWSVTADKVAAHPALNVEPHLEVHFSYLPLSHVYELAFTGVMVRHSARIGFSTGSPVRLLDDIQACKPTFILGVPRVWKRIHDKVMETVNSSAFYKRCLFHYAYSAVSQAEETGVPTWIDWGKLVFSAVRAKLGGRCRFICNAAAPLPPELSMWLSRVMGVEVVLIYGLTECSGGILASVYPYSLRNRSSVGYPCIHGAIRLVDVPELGYTTSVRPARGEILSTGDSNMLGYYKDPQLTAEALEREPNTGRVWFHTGDIGQLNEDGTVSLIDRRKNLFKLAQGEFVPCELIETLFTHSPAVAQAWVHGESTDTFVVAIIVPNLEALAKAAQIPSNLRALAATAQRELAGANARRLCDAPEVRGYVMAELRRIAEEASLPHFQWPRAIWLDPDPWTAENGLTTPTFKLKRPALREKYASQLHQLLEQVRAETSAQQPQ